MPSRLGQFCLAAWLNANRLNRRQKQRRRETQERQKRWAQKKSETAKASGDCQADNIYELCDELGAPLQVAKFERVQGDDDGIEDCC